MSQQNDDFISFERALRDLQLQSEELKKLVSEGEIRAFRDGDSMRFRREDVDSLRESDVGDAGLEEEELVFTDSLEDDTGMVTEELSDEDTLLADDDEDEAFSAEVASPGIAAAAAGTPRGARARAAVEEAETKEPAWVTAAAIVGTVAMLYGAMLCYQLAMGLPPSGLTGMWAPS